MAARSGTEDLSVTGCGKVNENRVEVMVRWCTADAAANGEAEGVRKE